MKKLNTLLLLVMLLLISCTLSNTDDGTELSYKLFISSRLDTQSIIYCFEYDHEGFSLIDSLIVPYEITEFTTVNNRIFTSSYMGNSREYSPLYIYEIEDNKIAYSDSQSFNSEYISLSEAAGKLIIREMDRVGIFEIQDTLCNIAYIATAFEGGGVWETYNDTILVGSVRGMCLIDANTQEIIASETELPVTTSIIYDFKIINKTVYGSTLDNYYVQNNSTSYISYDIANNTFEKINENELPYGFINGYNENIIASNYENNELYLITRNNDEFVFIDTLTTTKKVWGIFIDNNITFTLEADENGIGLQVQAIDISENTMSKLDYQLINGKLGCIQNLMIK